MKRSTCRNIVYRKGRLINVLRRMTELSNNPAGHYSGSHRQVYMFAQTHIFSFIYQLDERAHVPCTAV